MRDFIGGDFHDIWLQWKAIVLFRCCSVNYDLETKLVRKKFLPILAMTKQVLKYKADSIYRNIVTIIAMVIII